jgi:ribosomal protein S8
MSLNSTLADTLTRIRNAQSSNKAFTIVKSSKNVKDVLSVLEPEGYIAGFQEA